MKTKKILIILMLIISFSIIFQINTVQAALQSNTNTPTTKSRNTWMTEIRQMESLGGTLGLQEEINTDLTFKGDSNKLDIHLQKNTEYGAMALLSASSYGNPEKIQANETTTGNATGVVIPYTAEWTAAQYTERYGNSSSYANRYLNFYSANSYQRRIGDATIETQGWHGTTYVYFTSYYKAGDKQRWPGGLVRNTGNGIFSYNNALFSGWSWDAVQGGVADVNIAHTSRAVIINGEGI